MATKSTKTQEDQAKLEEYPNEIKTLKGMLGILDQQRGTLDTLLNGRQELLNEVMKSDDYQTLSEDIEKYKNIVMETETRVKMLAQWLYLASEVKRLPGVTVKEFFPMEVTDPDALRRYCLREYPAAVKIDEKKALQLAKTLWEIPDKRVPGVIQTTTTDYQIASNLGEFNPDVQEKRDANE